ncbi:LptF/LptG family permease [Gloeothece citriformis]|nr:LptF/LptG family permease [Gloeothece citriformis]
MDRYLTSQLIPPFVLSVGIFTSMGVALANLSDLSNKVFEYDLPVIDALKILLYRVPEFFAYALPISVLLTTLMTYGRLSSESELIALRSCGISLWRATVPAVILSVIVSGITFVFSEGVVPETNYRATEILVKVLHEERNFWQNKDIFYPNYEEVKLANGQTFRQLKTLFYAEKFDGQKMRSLTIINWLGDHLNEIVVSDSAQWNANQNIWDFFNGTVYLIDTDKSYKEAVPFKHQQFPLPKEAFEFATQGRNPYEMNLFQALQYKRLLEASGDNKNVRFFDVRIHQKIAFPFVCLVFGIMGAAIGAKPQQMSRGTSLGLTVGIVFSYYMLNFFTGSFGMIGLLSPMMAAWLPNLFGVGIGGWILKKLEN